MSLLTRASVAAELEGLARDALHRIVNEHGLHVADIAMVDRSRANEAVDAETGAIVLGSSEAPGRSGERGASARKRLAQTWAIVAQAHASLVAGSKMTQRELWYRLKTTGLFASPQQVNDRVLDVCAAVTLRAGLPCPREALGIIAAPRGSMTGCITLLPAEGSDAPARDLDTDVYQVPGDTEAIRALRIAPGSRARCVLVVEKDSVFRRLVDDHFTQRWMPCVIITACGFPDLATRALTRVVVEALGVQPYCLTDYNPHGMALMLSYKVGSARLGLEGQCCPMLRWIGLRHADVTPHQHPSSHGIGGHVEGLSLPEDSFQPFTQRDRSVLAGLARRPVVSESAGLGREVELMQQAGFKVEIEALYSFGFDYLCRYIQAKVIEATGDDDGGDTDIDDGDVDGDHGSGHHGEHAHTYGGHGGHGGLGGRGKRRRWEGDGEEGEGEDGDEDDEVVDSPLTESLCDSQLSSPPSGLHHPYHYGHGHPLGHEPSRPQPHTHHTYGGAEAGGAGEAGGGGEEEDDWLHESAPDW